MATVQSKRGTMPRGTARWSGGKRGVQLPATGLLWISGPATIDEQSSVNWAQFGGSNQDFDVSEDQVAADPQGTIVSQADSVILPAGTYIAELAVNMDVSGAGGEYKAAITDTSTGVSTKILSWRSAQVQDVGGGFSALDVKRVASRISMLFDTSEYIEGAAHTALGQADVTIADNRDEPRQVCVRFNNNAAAGAGAATLESGSYVRFTRLGPPGMLTQQSGNA